MPRVKESLWLAVPGDAHVAGRDAAHRAVVVVEHFGRGKARIDFDAERLRLRRQPAADIAERADIAVMIVHQRRHREVRQPDRAGRRHPVEAVVLDLRLQRTIGVLAPVRNQLVERDRIDHRARQDMRADLGTLLHHDDVEIGIELLQPDRRGQAGRPGADDHDVEFHGFARRKFFCAHDLISARLRTALKARCFRFLRRGQPWKCNARRFAPARSILDWHNGFDPRTRAYRPAIAGLLSGGRGRLRAGGRAGRPAGRARRPHSPRSGPRDGATPPVAGNARPRRRQFRAAK